jgi:large subunit ribosomal protein L19
MNYFFLQNANLCYIIKYTSINPYNNQPTNMLRINHNHPFHSILNNKIPWKYNNNFLPPFSKTTNLLLLQQQQKNLTKQSLLFSTSTISSTTIPSSSPSIHPPTSTHHYRQQKLSPLISSFLQSNNTNNNNDVIKPNTILRPNSKTLPKLNFYVGKQKEPTKRAGAILENLHKALVQDTKEKTWAMTLRSGDSVEVLYKDTLSSERISSVTGVIIGIKRPQSYNAAIRVLGVIGQSRMEYIFPLHSPMVIDVKLLQKAFIKKGKRRVRRSKLYYLKELPLSTYRVQPSKQTIAERERIAANKKKAMEEEGKRKKGAPSNKPKATKA